MFALTVGATIAVRKSGATLHGRFYVAPTAPKMLRNEIGSVKPAYHGSVKDPVGNLRAMLHKAMATFG